MVTGRRVAIVDGLRTPFVKSGTDFKDHSTLDLSAAVVNELLQRAGVEGGQVDQVVYGSVIPDLEGPNLAREIVLRADMPQTVDAYSVTRAWVLVAQAILTGDADVVIAGGADSLSKPPILYSDTFVDALMQANSAKDPLSKVKAFGSVRPKDLAPQPPALAERSTGLTMGESAEKMARENGITREDQDQYAYESHMKAVEAWEKGVYDDEVMPIPVKGYRETVSRDGIPRAHRGVTHQREAIRLIEAEMAAAQVQTPPDFLVDGWLRLGRLQWLRGELADAAAAYRRAVAARNNDISARSDLATEDAARFYFENGAANVIAGAKTPLEVLGEADQALYRAKEAGRDRIVR